MSPAVPSAARERAFNLPGLLVASMGVLIAIQAARAWIDDATDLRLLLDLSFIPAPWSLASGFATPDEILSAAGESGDEGQARAQQALARYIVAEAPLRVWSSLSYALLHGSWTHVLLNCVWLAAFGSPVARRAGTARTAALAILSALGGALAQWVSDPLGVQPTIGASAVVSGFMAAAGTFIFSRPDRGSHDGTRWGFLRSRGALAFMAIWLLGNLVFGVIAVPLGISDAAIAWQAHIGGFLVGLLLFPLIDPGLVPAAWREP